MNNALFILLGIAAFIFIIRAIRRYTDKRDEKRRQDYIDKNIEWQVNELPFNEMTLEVLATHSDKKRMAMIASTRIEDYIKMGVHPEKLVKILENLGVFMPSKNQYSDKALELAALIQQYALRSLDAHDLQVYQIDISKDMKGGFQKLNKTFLTKVHDDMLIWSPLN